MSSNPERVTAITKIAPFLFDADYCIGRYQYITVKSHDLPLRRIRSTWIHPVELDTLARVFEGEDIYVQLNLSKNRDCYKPAADDIAAVRMILVDVDPACEWSMVTGDKEYLLEKIPEIFDNAIGATSDDYLTIDSGRGLQFWLRMHPMAPAKDTREGIKRLGKLLKAEIEALRGVSFRCPGPPLAKVDPCFDIARIARLPGTINTKTGRRACVIHAPTGAPTGAVNRKVHELSLLPGLDSFVTKGSGGDIADFMPHIPLSAVDFLVFGAVAGERNNRAFAAACALYEAGASHDLVVKAITSAGKGSGLTMHEIMAVIESARKKVQ